MRINFYKITSVPLMVPFYANANANSQIPTPNLIPN